MVIGGVAATATGNHGRVHRRIAVTSRCERQRKGLCLMDTEWLFHSQRFPANVMPLRGANAASVSLQRLVRRHSLAVTSSAIPLDLVPDPHSSRSPECRLGSTYRSIPFPMLGETQEILCCRES